MERLTEWMGGHAAVVNHHANYIDRLAAYEDTGLEPREIESIVDAYGRGMTLRQENGERLRLIHGISTDRLRELVQAEKDGQVMMLRAPVGTWVYRIVTTVGNRWLEHPFVKLTRVSMTNVTAINLQFGRSVFLTREEAERVLVTDINVGSKEGGGFDG